jgi:gibberellin 3-beta-dioxygenase
MFSLSAPLLAGSGQFSLNGKDISTSACRSHLPNQSFVSQTVTSPPSELSVGSLDPPPPAIPIIDLAAVRAASLQGSSKTQGGAVLATACKEWGIFQALNHGVPEELIERYRTQMLSIFSLPMEQKQEAERSPMTGMRGYQMRENSGPLELFQVEAGNEGVVQDYAQKLFPDSSPAEFCATFKECNVAFWNLAMEILDLLIAELGVNPSHFDIFKTEAEGMLRANFYHRSESTEQVLGLDPHMDGGLLTILLQDDVSGLEVVKDGQWVQVMPHKHALCINMADMLQVLTNGHLKSIQHRAVVSKTGARLTAAYFVFPKPSVVVTSAPEFVDANNPPLYRPFTWREFAEQQKRIKPNPSSLPYFKAAAEDN